MQARIAITTAALALLTACGGGGGGSAGGFALLTTQSDNGTAPATKAPTVEQPPEKAPQCSVAFWGDSIAGQVAPKLGKGLQLQNHATPAHTAGMDLGAFLQDPLVARFVVIEYGTNDANFGSDLYGPLRSMLDWVKAKGRTAVLTGLSNGTVGNAAARATYNALTVQLAKEYGALFADWPSVQYDSVSDLTDGVHPDADYQQRLADRLTQTIVAVAPECQP